MKRSSTIPGLGLLAALAGCASYEPRPLDARAELAALAARGLPDAVTVRSTGPDGSDHPAAFDASDGLSEDEAVAVALTLNPDLQAARESLGESAALLVSARVLPNPEIGVGYRAGFNGTPGFAVDADFLFELLKPGERSARVAAASARSEATRAGVLSQEYVLATEVRRGVFAVLVAEHLAAILDQETTLRERAVAVIRQRRSVGEGNELDVSAAELDLAEVRRDRRLASVELQKAALELNRLLGLPPSYQVHLSDAGKPLSVTIFEDPSDATLQERMLAGRLDLRAKEAEYLVAEEELRLAVARQYPRLKLGPSYEHEGISDNYIGVAALIELPVFDRNQGGIAAGTAARNRLHAEYTALLHHLSAQAFAARARVRAAQAEIETQERDVLPLLSRNQELFRGAFEARELGVLDWITAQQRALRTRRAYLESLAAYRLARLDLDAAMGWSMRGLLCADTSDEATKRRSDEGEDRETGY